MSTVKSFGFDAKKLFSWQFLLLKVMLLALVAVAVEKPHGGMTGKIALGKKQFGLHTYDVKSNKVYVIAEGPRKGVSIERGVWVKQNGDFTFDNLPVGEYQIRVRAKGFASAEQYGIFVEDGKVTELDKSLDMDVLEPSVSLAQTTRVFTSKEEASLFLNVTGANDGEVKLFKIDFLPFVQKPTNTIECGPDLNIYKDSTTDPVPQGFLKGTALSTRACKLELDWTDSGHTQVNFGKLPKGDYLVYAKVKGMTGEKTADNVTWFSVSDIGLIVKRDQHRSIINAVDLVTLKPVKDCVIRGYSLPLKKYVTAPLKTDAKGLLEIQDSSKGKVTAIVPPGSPSSSVDVTNATFFVGQVGNNMAYGAQLNRSAEPATYRSYFYTDKPIYRLGQTVSYKAICRKEVDGQLINPGATLTMKAHIEDPSNNQVWEGQVKTDKFGAYTGTFTIPEDGSTGAYQLVTEFPGGNSSYGSFEIDEYRKPEFQVEISPLTPRVVAGQKARAQVKASYFFGAPVANASVKYTIYSNSDYSTRWRLESRPDYFSFFDSWNSGDSYGSGGSLVTTGTAQTDENGLAVIEYDTERSTKPEEGGADEENNPNPFAHEASDKQYRFEAEVTDLSRMTQVASGNVAVTAGDFAVYVQPDQYVVKSGDKFKVGVQAINYDGTPVKNQPVEVKVERWVYDTVNHRYTGHEQVAELPCTTGADGKATVQMSSKDSWPSDTFYVSAVTKDKFNNKIMDSTTFWVASENYAYSRDDSDAAKQTVSITTDKQIYKPGETAKVMITAPVTGKEGINAVVTVEGAVLYQCKVIPLDATAKYVEIPLTKDLAPNAFISVAFVGNKHQFYTAEQEIKVSPENNFLQMAVTSDKDRYKPGDTVHYTISAKRADGTPAANTEVSLGVVDESIYAIRAEQAEDIKKFFYTRRENAVVTSCSFPVMYSAGPDKIEPRVRKDFRDTAAWLPNLVTDKDGIAVADVKLPDNLTSWRATVRGVSMSMDVGSTTQKVLCTQDLILRIALPRFFNEGDQGLITAIVHNYTKLPQSIKLSLTASNQFAVDTALTQTASVEPEKAYRYSWPVTITGSGTGVISAKAIGQTSGDAMETKLPIHPLGLPAFSVKSGMVTDENATLHLPVGMSADAVKGTEKANLQLSASSIGPVLGNFDALIDYPYGCTEQTLSRMVPSMVAMQLHKRLNLPITAEQSKKFADVQKQSLEKLRGYHHDDGGWGWWATDESNPYLTAHVVSGLSLLKETGYSAEDQMITSGLKWLSLTSLNMHKQLIDPKLKKDDMWSLYIIRQNETDLAKMLYTLSQWSVTPEQIQEIFPPAVKPSTTSAPADSSATAGASSPAPSPTPTPDAKKIATSAASGKKGKIATKKKTLKLVYHSELTPLSSSPASTDAVKPAPGGSVATGTSGGSDAKSTPSAADTTSDPKAAKPIVSTDKPPVSIPSITDIQSNKRNVPPCVVRDYLAKNMESISHEALVYFILASKNLGDDINAKKGYALLLKRGSVDAGMTNWSSSSWDYRFCSVEATALGLRAVLAVEPENTKLIEGIKQWLLLQHGKDGWDNTKTTAEVFMVLLTEELQHKTKTPTSYDVKVVESGKQLFDLAYNSTNMYGAEQNVKFDLTPKPQMMDISKTGPGRLYYTTAVSYFRKLLPGDQIAAKGIPQGLTIDRKFYRLKADKEPDADGKIHFRSEEIVDHQIKAGEVIMMKTTVNSPIPLPYVKVESRLPSGAEVVKFDSREDSTDEFKYDWATAWWTHEDDLDDKIVYFGTQLPKGPSVFHSMLRMELPGKMEVMPTTLEAMYSNKIRGYSQLDQLTVKE